MSNYDLKKEDKNGVYRYFRKVECPKCFKIRFVDERNYNRKSFTGLCIECSLRQKGKDSRKWNGGLLKCSDCGKQLGRYKAKRCRVCAAKLRMGENHFNWKGGTSSEDRLQRIKFRQTIQKQVFERDNYTCQICGAKGVLLQVDHIQSWAEYVKLRFDINNCRTLCMDCHYKITFGKPKPKNIKVWGHNLNYFIKGGY